jgi:putative FmdB family regulatory protein
MPTYQYICRDCDHEFEAVQSMRDDALTVCPSCGGTLRKVYAPPAISFKGSGFYATDHGRRKPSEKPSDGQKDDKKDGKKDQKGDEKHDKGAKSGSSSTEGTASKPAKETAAT